MNKAVLISIQPKWCELIASGKKTVEVRKTKPKIQTPFKCYIYCTNDNFKSIFQSKPYLTHGNFQVCNGKVIGEFVCEKIDRIERRGIHNNFDYCYLSLNEWGNDDIEVEITDIKKSCISKEELTLYGENSSCLYGWHISDLVIYDKLRKLSEFGHTQEYVNKTRKSVQHWEYGVYEELVKPLTRPPQNWCYVEERRTE